MNMKKVVAPTMAQAMKTIKDELGDNAVILQSKAIYHGGIFGFFKKKKFEVIAAQDAPAVPPAQAFQKMNRKAHDSEPWKIAEGNAEAASPPVDRSGSIMAELSELKKLVAMGKTPFDARIFHYPPVIQSSLLMLQKNDVDEKIVFDIGDKLLNRWRGSGSVADDIVIQWTEEEILKKIEPFAIADNGLSRQFVALAGPTGVGKTTTLAKLAASEVLEKKNKVAFITADTYRIAAIDQLKTYAELLGVPVEVVFSREDFLLACEKFAEFDTVFIDTPGRNYRETKFVTELKELLDGNEQLETFLVLSLSMR
ncbi:MAG TPA: flagellar biosynthesis protein FlhF, partial [Bacillaceae bacterium]